MIRGLLHHETFPLSRRNVGVRALLHRRGTDLGVLGEVVEAVDGKVKLARLGELAHARAQGHQVLLRNVGRQPHVALAEARGVTGVRQNKYIVHDGRGGPPKVRWK